MQTAPTLRNTGPIEARDFGPMGRRLGTFADCYDGSPWELHRGELIEQMGSRDIHGVIMAIVAALFRNHARDGMSVMTDVYCELSDDEGPSLRAPDVVLVRDLVNPRNDVYRGTPVLAVEVRGTQSKRYLEEKVKLYLAHDWPVVWIAHAGRQELEVVRRGMASVTYRLKVEVPLVPELDKYGLRGVPAVAIFDQQEASRVTDQWVHVDGETIGQARGETIGQARGETIGQARAVLRILATRGFHVPEPLRVRVLACNDLAMLDRWLAVAMSAPSVEAFGRVLE